MRAPGVLLILDGYGISPVSPTNAVENAHTPNLKRLRTENSSLLDASGSAVGLREGLMGSSEVNHLNMGAGRVVEQSIVRIDHAIQDGSLEKNPILINALQTHGCVHIIGLLSDGGIHSHIDHLNALISIAKKNNHDKIFVHAILDGRDTAQQAAGKWLSQIDKNPYAEIVSVCGRYFAMDRDNRWDRTQQAFEVMTGLGPIAMSWQQILDETYAQGKSDEFVPAHRLGTTQINHGDSVIFFNFREDRARQLTAAFTSENFTGFDREKPEVMFTQMTEYDKKFHLPTLFPPLDMQNVVAQWLSTNDVSSLHIAETEKYAHVTFFFNGGREEPFEKEDRIIIPSPKVATYDQKPQMSVHEITSAVLDDISKDGHQTYIINFANSDMVGHTGNYEATIQALEHIDTCVGQIEEIVREKEGFLIVTADHGNAEDMSGEETTTHTTNPVPFMLSHPNSPQLHNGIIPDIGPTFLELLELPIPKEMTAKSLLKAR